MFNHGLREQSPEKCDLGRIKKLIGLYGDSTQIRTLLDLIGRYQSPLDNEIYMALRAWREVKNWRASRLDPEARCVDVCEPEK